VRSYSGLSRSICPYSIDGITAQDISTGTLWSVLLPYCDNHHLADYSVVPVSDDTRETTIPWRNYKR
jgi:hypothetical protein